MRMNDDEMNSVKDVLKRLGGFGDSLDAVDVVVFTVETGATILFAIGMRRATTWMRMGLSALLKG